MSNYPNIHIRHANKDMWSQLYQSTLDLCAFLTLLYRDYFSFILFVSGMTPRAASSAHILMTYLMSQQGCQSGAKFGQISKQVGQRVKIYFKLMILKKFQICAVCG